MVFHHAGEMTKQIRDNHPIRIFILLIVLVLFFSLFSTNVFASETIESPRAKTVRVGYFPVDGFQEYDEETGVYSGYGYEFLMAISAYTDWQYEFVRCDTFAEAFAKLEKGEVDLLNDIGKVEGREIEYSSLSAGDGCSYLLMRDGDNRVAYNDWEGIAGIKIGFDKESAFNGQLLSILAEHNVVPNIIWYDDELKMFKAWEDGEVDACVAMSDTAIDGHAIMIFAPRMYYLAATKGNKELISEVDFAMQALRANAPDFESTLYKKYYNRVSRNYSALTQDEKEYIKENPVVRVLYVPDWYPMSYQDENGEFTGPFKKIYDLLQERTGLQFEFVPIDSDKPFESIVDTYNCYMLAEHPADYTGAATYDVKLTQTIVNAALVEVTKGTLKKGDTIALVEGDCLSEVVQRILGSDFEYSMQDSIEECVKKVQDGTVDGTVLMSYESEYYQSQRQYRNLIYTVVNNGSYGYGLAVSNEADPRLYSIIVKGLNSISAGEVNNIFNQMTQDLQKTSLLDTVLANPLPFAAGGISVAAILVFAITSIFFSKKIKEKNEELILANASTTQFFSRMSHDMRTPMNGILGIAELSKDDNDVDILHGEIRKIQQSGEYLLSLINDTLDFQRIESGNLSLEKEIINSSEVLENIEVLVSSTAKNKNVDFRVMSQKQVSEEYIWADPMRLKQILINLLSNAIKFTPAGGTVTLGHERSEQGEMMIHDRFYVQDTGIGVSQEFMDTKMFQPFNQEHNKVTGQYAGTGLGLSIVKSLVDLMGGNIQVESELGTGTTFIIDLDFEKVKAEDLKKFQEKNESEKDCYIQNSKEGKVLLVEDHPLNAEIATRLLEKAGYDVDWAKNGQEAVEVYTHSALNYYRVILMDIRMPVMNGLEASKKIRHLDRDDAKNVPIIAMTANAYDSDIKDCLEVGMNEHISKPIEPQVLLEKLANYIPD